LVLSKQIDDDDEDYDIPQQNIVSNTNNF